MRKFMPVVTLLLLTLAVGTASADEVRARRRPARAPAPATPAFATTVEYTGPLEGSISIGGRVARIAPGANLYEIGRGGLTAKDYVAGRMVFVTGHEMPEGLVITQMIVRPAPNRALARANQELFIKSRPLSEGPR